MKTPRRYLPIFVILSGIAIALIYLLPDRQIDPPRAPQNPKPSATVQPPPASVVVRPPPPLNQAGLDAPLPQASDPLDELKRRLDDPNQREANLRRAKLNVEQMHGRIFQRLRDLPPEMLDRLKTVLAESQLAMERGALPDYLPVDEISAKAAGEKLEQIRQEGDEQVRALLGDDGFAQYDFSRKAEPYRQSVEEITNIMRARGSNVTEEMQERILDGYASALIATAKASANDTTPESFLALSESAREELRLKQQLRFDEILTATMWTVLSPAECKLFMESQFTRDQASH